MITLLYIDDLVKGIIKLIFSKNNKTYFNIYPQYKISLGKLAEKIINFQESKNNLIINKVGKGLERALYSTYCSFIDKSAFFYKLKTNSDSENFL